MARPKAELRLGAFFNPTGHHVASWRHERAQADAGINFKHYVEIAQTAERGKFDMIFLADNVCVREAKMEALSRSAQYIANFEPITLISALAAVTSRIGLTCTASTSYNIARPYQRRTGGMESRDLRNGGRGAELQP
jgi:alkanesulfonate monooxygenase SsuD/methylene tetrahydromethanopterin reductase-like flavin-dependent oxidoreductase (luciferase family)